MLGLEVAPAGCGVYYREQLEKAWDEIAFVIKNAK
jgi:hypothetical protein